MPAGEPVGLSSSGRTDMLLPLHRRQCLPSLPLCKSYPAWNYVLCLHGEFKIKRTWEGDILPEAKPQTLFENLNLTIPVLGLLKVKSVSELAHQNSASILMDDLWPPKPQVRHHSLSSLCSPPSTTDEGTHLSSPVSCCSWVIKQPQHLCTSETNRSKLNVNGKVWESSQKYGT